MKITAIRGFNDILPPESETFGHIEGEARRLFSNYGYSEIRIPIVEKTSLFQRSIGETTDIVEKEMYTFMDRRGDSITLRPEGTAPVVRAYIEHGLYNDSPITKLYYTGPMFRYERPQKGRYRQFYQIGAEVLGDDSPGMDAEVLEMASALFTRLGVKGATLQINSMGCAECRPGYKENLTGFLGDRKEKLCKDCVRRIDVNPLRALDCKNPGCIEATRDAPRILDFLCNNCSAHFDSLKGHLETLGVGAKVNPRMVRGLDYYTKTSFEITAPESGNLGSQNAIAAGGRYDGLVKDLGGPDTPCIGFAIGMERAALLVKDKDIKKRPLVVFIAMGEEAEKSSFSIVKMLREKDMRVAADYGCGSLKSRMKRADRTGARFTIILGDDELNDGVVTVKDMASGEQERLSPESIVNKIRGEAL
jgi:histidyl-tRNA synthetase